MASEKHIHFYGTKFQNEKLSSSVSFGQLYCCNLYFHGCLKNRYMWNDQGRTKRASRRQQTKIALVWMKFGYTIRSMTLQLDF